VSRRVVQIITKSLSACAGQLSTLKRRHNIQVSGKGDSNPWSVLEIQFSRRTWGSRSSEWLTQFTVQNIPLKINSCYGNQQIQRFYDPWRSINRVTKCQHWKEISVTPIHSIPLRSILILSSHLLHLGFQRDVLPLRFPAKLCLYFWIHLCQLHVSPITFSSTSY
jgi:hypothetical protein